MAVPATRTAAQLKEEGNALFVKKEFERAHDKYTEAIAIDDRSAVLYANRSACNYGMRRYLNALADACKATGLDPGYAKGWSRCASAHEAVEQWSFAVDAWQHALDALDKGGDLAPAERAQRVQYAASLNKARERLEAAQRVPPVGLMIGKAEKTPWQLAEELLPKCSSDSSAWLLHYANRQFVEGVEDMNKFKEVDVNHPSGKRIMLGHTGAITGLSNGIMADSRVSRIDCANWMDKYSRQLVFEFEKNRAWVADCVDVIQQSALQRLKKEGWGGVRPALAIVVRGWYMRAVFDCLLRKVPHAAVERLKMTLELLHWGRQVWRDVHKNDRGVIFEDTFVRGVKVMYLEALMEAHVHATGADKQGYLDTLFEAAGELLQEMQSAAEVGRSTHEAAEPGFILAFYVYPVAQAHAMLGYFHVQMAQTSNSTKDKKMHYLLSTEHYGRAAQTLPADEEKLCWYSNCAIDACLHAGVPKDRVIKIIEAIHAGMPIMQRIWANSALAKQGRDAMIEETLRTAEEKLK